MASWVTEVTVDTAFMKMDLKSYFSTLNISIWLTSLMGWFWFSTKRLLQLGACVVCACSQWMVVTEVIRVTLPDLCAGSIIQKSYQQCKLHFPSRSDKELIGGGKLEWSSQAWPGISKRYTLIVWLLKSPFTWSYSQPPPNRPSRPSDLDKAISLCSVVNVKKTKCWIFISRSFIYRHAHQNWLQLGLKK